MDNFPAKSIEDTIFDAVMQQHPNSKFDSEYESDHESSSQVASSNLSASEPSPDPSKDTTTLSSSSLPLDLDLSLQLQHSQDPAHLKPPAPEHDPGNASAPATPPPGAGVQPRVFSCNYCRRKFYSSQALGGHQNAHKRERTIAKRAMRMGIFSDRYNSLASLPLHGVSAFRNLGIKAHSATHHSNMIPFQRMPPQAHPHPQQQAPLSAARFEQSYYGVPVLTTTEEDDVGMYWPGSFRQVVATGGAVSIPAANNHNNNNQFGHLQYAERRLNSNSTSSFVAMEVPDSSSLAPDLTLKL
ncbi:unnamed protein product [Linum tenue]|uniref:C2H2-type domain-containing protein n=1 Tax=Linum tenue TaxID=586396 RepID=A0AAV0R047_9ROSI|nr:unnamed protein product [Linum tenue]